MSAKNALCTCGHVQEAHEHYRRGSDCAICGAETCHRFRRDRHAIEKTVPMVPVVQPVVVTSRQRKVG